MMGSGIARVVICMLGGEGLSIDTISIQKGLRHADEVKTSLATISTPARIADRRTYLFSKVLAERRYRTARYNIQYQFFIVRQKT